MSWLRLNEISATLFGDLRFKISTLLEPSSNALIRIVDKNTPIFASKLLWLIQDDRKFTGHMYHYVTEWLHWEDPARLFNSLNT